MTPPGCAVSQPEPAPPPAAPRSATFQFLEDNFGLDLRSLAFFRVALALIVIGDLIYRARDLEAFYTDFGLLPRYTLIGQFADRWIISVHNMSGLWQVQALLFLIAGIFAVMMLLGWRTRLATFLCWFMVLSLDNRNPVILQGGDTLFRMLLFWAMFLPLGAYYSVDAALDPEPVRPRPQRIFSVASLALMLQIAFVYWFSVIAKSGPEWRHDGTAVYFALSLEQFATPFGHWMTRFPGFLRFLTFFTLVVEALGPVFLFIPGFKGAFRMLGVMFLIGLQLGFASMLWVGHFPFIGTAMMLAMIPSWFWDTALFTNTRRDARKQARTALKIYYDGDCSFCKKFVLILRELLVMPEVAAVPAQSVAAVQQQMTAENSWVVIDAEGKSHFRFDALSLLHKHSPIFLYRWRGHLIGWLPLQRRLDRLYYWVERNRPRLSRATAFLSYRKMHERTSALNQTVALFFLAYVFWWNLGNVNEKYVMPVEYHWIGIATRVDQIWDMFSPGPLRDDGWYVIPAQLKNGKEIDLWRNGAPVSWDRPSAAAVAGQYRDERWRKYMNNLYFDIYAPYRLHFGRYLCRYWNRDKSPNDPDSVQRFRIEFMMRSNLGPGVSSTPRRVTLHEHQCYD
ncbi:MAG: HTTM domain-containing protein [Acidobacteriales bacterium]|nr:HTTM domain-containing protein [Terriglobales bacterium]